MIPNKLRGLGDMAKLSVKFIGPLMPVSIDFFLRRLLSSNHDTNSARNILAHC